MKQIQLNLVIPAPLAGQRLDQALAHLLPEYSRSRIQQWLEQQMILVNGQPAKSRAKVLGNEKIVVNASLIETNPEWQPEEIGLSIVYEDADILVINKPAGLVVHPAAGNYTGTLLNALLHHLPELVALPRAGIVHRLDKETSGLLVVAKTLEAHTHLVKQLQARTVKRQYEALVVGNLITSGTIDAPIGRHSLDRKRMAVVTQGKPAITHYTVLQNFSGFTHLQVNLETGRTHQIRVHMTHLKHPLIGDPVYGKRQKLTKAVPHELKETVSGFKRQALHARRLGLLHPSNGIYMEWEAPLPTDMIKLIEQLYFYHY
ncbi:MAG: pseudouridine synthase [Gammaproteobacteria bacterium]|jgi:23S rRNA pseudouridine1911/1915/1917 synthase|nr:pseudouridine synthase [Gammaproteobacteria bacterium]